VLKQLQEDVNLTELAEVIETSGLNGVIGTLRIEQRMTALAQGARMDPRKETLVDAIRAVFEAGARNELEALRVVPIQKVQKAKPTIGFDLAFDLRNPNAEQFLSTYTMSLIRNISAETQQAVGGVVLGAFEAGGHPYEQARKIKQFIGLTPKQAQAVLNFERMLSSGVPTRVAESLTRELRDKRFDASILRSLRTQVPIPKSKIDEMVRRYHLRYVQYRAKAIARTETIRAANAGQKETWRQAAQQGLLDKQKTKKFWVLAPEACPVCTDIEAMNKDGVQIDQSFVTPDGTLEHAPAHPHCRCSQALKFTSGGAVRPTTVKPPAPSSLLGNEQFGVSRGVDRVTPEMLANVGKLQADIDVFKSSMNSVDPRVSRFVASRLGSDPDILALHKALKETTAFEGALAPFKLDVKGVKSPSEQLLNFFSREWNSSSGDDQKSSLLLQRAVEAEFGLTPYKPFRDRAIWDATETLFKQHETALRKIARSLYEETQERLSALGINEVHLWRGTKETGLPRTPVNRAFETKPLTSFSNSSVEAAEFTSDTGGVVHGTIVPRERVFSYPATGLGTTDEAEVVVLGRTINVTSVPVRTLDNFKEQVQN
jgi:hypothetical protein